MINTFLRFICPPLAWLEEFAVKLELTKALQQCLEDLAELQKSLGRATFSDQDFDRNTLELSLPEVPDVGSALEYFKGLQIISKQIRDALTLDIIGEDVLNKILTNLETATSFTCKGSNPRLLTKHIRAISYAQGKVAMI